MPPITQYSKIQHRRGLQSQLPSALNTSELGHSLDQRRLFIGNGEIAEGATVTGNTEIITDFTLLSNPTALKYIYLSNTSVIAQTGQSANAPVVRSVTQILDDRVSVKSFGAIGDGIADDTAAINRAIQQLFCVSIANPQAQEMAYRKLYFPAGRYKISNYVYLPPFAELEGDGMSKSVIFMSIASMNGVVRTADSLFQNDLALGTNSALLPRNIHVKDMSWQHVADKSVLQLERASHVLFENCSFSAANSGSASGHAAITINKLGSVYVPENIVFKQCEMSQCDYGVLTNTVGQDSTSVQLLSCRLRSLNYGVTLDTVTDVKLLDNTFASIAKNAITVKSGSSNASVTNNTFVACGSVSDAVVLVESGASKCAFIDNKFISNTGANYSNSGSNVVILDHESDFVFKNIAISAKRDPITLAANATNASTTVTFDLTKVNTVFMDYTITRGTDTRIGQLRIFSGGSTGTTSIGDNFSESTTNATDITFGIAIASNILTITYTLNAGTAVVWNFQTKTWKT